MNWAEWTPQENIVISIREVLEEALVPDNEIQRNVQQKLKIIQNIGDYTYYLLFIMSNPNYSEEIRSLSGILLKNNICSIYATLTQDDILKIRQECLRLMKDPSKDIRASISNVLVIMAKDNLKTWPELVPFLVNSFEVPDDGGAEVGLKTLFSICEELIRDQKSDDEIYGVTREVFPKLNDFLSDERCAMKHEILRLFNQFLQDYFPILKQSVNVDTYLRNVMQLADNEDPEMQKYVCQTFVIFLDNREDCLLPHIQDIIVYLLAKTEHNDCEIALQACEFWLTASKLMNCKDLLGPFLDKLIPILLKNMIYSELELHAIKDSLGNDADIKDLSQDIYPVHISNGSDEYDEMVEKSLDDMDDFYVGWTLRKCSAASLDGISVKFGAELLPVLIPFLNELLLSHDYFVKESAILALGAIAEGCVVGLRPHLPFLINYLIEAMEDEHSIVRVIACWTLSRYVNWIINISPSSSLYFIPVMTVLLKHFVDDNKRVQRAAISAFCIFQEEAQSKLVPYIDFILEGFQQGFQRFHCRSLYLLYDAIGVLAQAVGGYLNKPEYLNKLLPPLMEKITQCDNFAEDHFVAVLECLASIIPVLELAFLPFSEVVYWHCLQMISDTLKAFVAYNENPSELDMPYKEPMNVAHDVLYSMALGLKTHFVKYVTNSNLVLLLRTTMQDDMVLIRQTAVALYGELVVLCFPYLANNIHDYVPIIVKNLDDRYDGVCNNAAWVLGKLCTYMGSGIQSYLPEILGAFVAILENPIVSKPMYQTVAVSFCILCYIFPDIAVNNIEILLRNCCMTIRNIKDTDEKDLAFRGLCKMVVYHPNFCKANFMYFCDAVASWNEPKLDLKEQIRSILVSFKDQCGENSWDLFYHQCPDALKMRLGALYGV